MLLRKNSTLRLAIPLQCTLHLLRCDSLIRRRFSNGQQHDEGKLEGCDPCSMRFTGALKRVKNNLSFDNLPFKPCSLCAPPDGLAALIF